VVVRVARRRIALLDEIASRAVEEVGGASVGVDLLLDLAEALKDCVRMISLLVLKPPTSLLVTIGAGTRSRRPNS